MSKPEVYMSSIIIKNYNVPKFEEYFGQLDFDWLLKISERKWQIVDQPTVKRYVDGKNLSLNQEYRKRDFHFAMLQIDGDKKAMQRLCGSRARYFYLIGEVKLARYYFKQSNLSIKNILYYFSSYSRLARNMIIKNFRVFG